MKMKQYKQALPEKLVKPMSLQTCDLQNACTRVQNWQRKPSGPDYQGIHALLPEHSTVPVMQSAVKTHAMVSVRELARFRPVRSSLLATNALSP